MVERWRTALAGDRESLGFGRRRNEEPPTVDAALRSGARRSALIVAGARVTSRARGAAAIFLRPDDDAAGRRISFGSTARPARVPIGSSARRPSSTKTVDATRSTVAVREGAGNARPHRPERDRRSVAVRAGARLGDSVSLRRTGQVVIVGPAGSCPRVFCRCRP
jgi:hypothetical protein